MNTALLSKQVWRLAHDTSSYWATTLKAIYFPNCSVWEANASRGSSQVWKSISQGRELLRASGRWIVGSGQQINITKDMWLGSGEKAYLKDNSTAIVVGDLLDCNKNWDINLLRQNLSSSSAIEAIKTPILWSASIDYISWPHCKEGSYTVKSGYRALLDQSPPMVSGPTTFNPTLENLWDLIWSTQVPNKVKHFIWKACQNILPTRENLYKKRIPISQLCPVCLTEIEIVEHIFLIGPWTKPLWFGLQIISIPSPMRITNIQNWIAQAIDSQWANLNQRSTWIFFTLWNTWKTRNDKVFNNRDPNPLNVLHCIKSQSVEFLASSSANPIEANRSNVDQSTQMQAPPAYWRPPQTSYTKINCDAAFDQASERGFTGIICRDAQGTVLTATSRQLYVCSALVAEAISLRDAASLACNFGLDSVVFESDNQILVEACKKNKVRGEIKGLVEDFNALRVNLQKSEVTWVRREGNQSAHAITSLARSNSLSGPWMSRPPDLLRKALVLDAQSLWRQRCLCPLLVVLCLSSSSQVFSA